MELKDYQQTVLKNLDSYLESLLASQGNMPKAFTDYWQERGVLNQNYKNNVKGVPHVCVKVPTAGGKTFIAVNAISHVFDAFQQFNPIRPKFVVWLVPSLTILEQTVKHLSNPDHPYRQRLNDLFNGRVQVYQKSEVLLGAGFNADSVKDQLSIVVMSFDSLKATNKENRKAYQGNGYLASFLQANTASGNYSLPEYDESSLINVIRSLKPVVVVDESHNAESPLSVDMLNNINPSFILDLTATPRNNSNIISYIDAMQLKKQHMVKLPVIVANQQSQEDVIMASLKMRLQLEEYAKQEEASGGEYIRPIVLFQAEPKSRNDTTTFEMVKKILIDLNIPEDQIKIKTANINELKGIDLMSRECEVRYIITVNALKEGWDCPFAYILATLANKSSVVDVTQILGRVLRMPHVRRHKVDYLNLSYVFTSSSRFKETLNSVVAGLNKAGFSHQDYRVMDALAIENTTGTNNLLQPSLDLTYPENVANTDTGIEENIDQTKLDQNWANEDLNAANDEAAESHQFNANTSVLDAVKAQALKESQAYEQSAAQHKDNECPPELEADMNLQRMKPNFIESASAIQLPQFFQKVETGGFFEDDEAWQKLSRNNLLKGFLLANLDSNVNFEDVDTEVYQVDLIDIGKGESAPEFSTVDQKQKQRLNQIIHNQSDAGQINSIVDRLFGLVGKNAFYPIEDNDIKKYLFRIVESMSHEQRGDCLEKDYLYIKVIKNKINSLADTYAFKEFDRWLTIGKIKLQPAFTFPPSIAPSKNAPAIAKSLYINEADINGFEHTIIQSVCASPNVIWWHRNLSRGKGFEINGSYLNHYPDFIILTANKNIIVIETKGGDRDNSDSTEKAKLGRKWADQSNQLSYSTGYKYHYLMIFQANKLEGTYLPYEAIDLIKNL